MDPSGTNRASTSASATTSAAPHATDTGSSAGSRLPAAASPDGPLQPPAATAAAPPVPAAETMPGPTGDLHPGIPLPQKRRNGHGYRGWGRLARRRMSGGWRRASDNLRGSILMIVALLAFGVMMAAIKAIGTSLPLTQVLMIRQVILTLLLMPLFLPDLRGALKTSRPGLQIFRGFCSLGAMMFGFTAIRHIPLTDATALGFSQVLFVTILAVLVLHEQVGPRRWIATAVGFVGVLIMLRPGGDGGLNVYALYAVAGAICGSGITVSVRILAQSEKTATILLYQAVFFTVALIVPTILWWVQPTPYEWVMLLLVGSFGTLGQYLITRAYQVGEAAALAPLDFIRLIIAALLGIFLFAEFPDLVTVVGAALVVGATIYTMRRNAIGKTAARLPAR